MSSASYSNQTTVGVILAGGKGQRLNQLNVAKPLVLAFGKQLIMYQIERLLEAGVTKIYIAVDNYASEVKSVLQNMSSAELIFIDRRGTGFSLVNSLQAVVEAVADDCFLTSCDLIFQDNPFKWFTKKDDIEVMIDKNIAANRFCGAGMTVKTSVFGQAVFGGEDMPDYNAFNAGVYYFTKAGLAKLADVLQGASAEMSFAEILDHLNKRGFIRLTQMPETTWFDINTPVTLMRAEMFLRSQHLSRRHTNVQVGNLKSVAPAFAFRYRREQTTDIIFEPGIISKLSRIRLMAPERTASHHILITDANVNVILGEAVEAQLKEAGYKVTKLVVPADESAKSMEVYNNLAEKIIALGIDEQSIIFALGGGVVANLSGFLASTLYRGIGLIHLPTTLMSMLDVSVSLKQGINGQKGKNLVGSYYQPLMVVIDPAIPMPDALVRDGLAEAIKHAVGQSKELFNYLLGYDGNLQDVGFITRVISDTIKLKIELMHEDMFEDQRAMILQYGHEVGHAIEFLSNFQYTHGQAIAIGMRVSAELAHLMQVTPPETVKAHEDIFKKYNLPYQIPPTIGRDVILESLRYNKKTRTTDMRMVLLEYIGRVWKIKGEFGIPCPPELISRALELSY
ncbi:hypothetical protein A2477_03900 [Candidatus Falkowbacteria bacterium RIFOXYC2_FULL_47_12]|uniref:3-dehydroquinate synthase domain-containing protein n=2 Tax=Candidatus Falkowiibacteriota TaxID=1752728 RepID=A0A1F5TP81_9BACT|nr:MAG: hypothetical protein A2242_04500 [Candidatus Falkowbacteria bacterium RIFOXYA2_FULL_47_9]OGF40618.1 MAG: hypothetical protein A2477_03900 [Candidatus Falkowbacteria bacterium RIFOXYC2_FULL_47_12]